MRQIKNIVIHCTATDQHATVEGIKNYWEKELGWKNPGYHYIIKPNGDIEQLLDVSKVANGVRGYNDNSIHISYIGGIDGEGNPKDTRTPEQKESMAFIIKELMSKNPDAYVLGHRDFPGVNKACPSFNVRKWFETGMHGKMTYESAIDVLSYYNKWRRGLDTMQPDPKIVGEAIDKVVSHKK